ncbi:Holliday junction recognition protein [Mustela lutreola]|uniref:Holliday junction recognition protein n=1 Tax=Mustela lutreola TaxID=9666 RepID=UPI0027971E0A|nr:Holliday junction recognition protein [Mustela lutreola]
MEDQLLGDDALLWQLRESRRRFQRHMQRLIEKYNQPFEDAPLVQMSTLTYETPQGLRIWGGGLVKERNTGHIQDSPVEAVSRSDGSPAEASTRGPAPSVPSTQVLAVDSKNNNDASLYQEDMIAGSFMPAVPWSPLKNKLRRKYLTQVDVLLQDEGRSECTDDGVGEDTPLTLSPSLASPAGPVHGSRGHVSRRSPGGPVKPASSTGECDPADLALVPRSDSLTFQGAEGHSRSSSPALEADIICDVTISDLYAGMLHSMSRLLSTKPACIISTKTSFIAHSRSSRRRHKCKNRMNQTPCRGAGLPQSVSQETLPSCSKPLKDRKVLRDCENFLDASGQKAAVELEKAFPEVNKPEIHKLDPRWNKLRGLKSLMPQGCSLTYRGTCTMHHLGQENRLKALKWLISPIKIVSRPRVLRDKGRNRYREIGIQFDKLHQEYCPNPGKQPCLTSLPGPSAVAVYRGGPVSPCSPRGLETRRLSGFQEAFKDLEERAIGTVRWNSEPLPLRGSPPLLSETSSVQSPGRSEQTLDLFQGNHFEILRKSVSPSKASSVAGRQPPSCGRNRYNEIKEKFDKLHQKYCQQSPQQTQAPLRIGTSPGGASLEVQYPRGSALEKANPDSGFHGPPKRSASPQWSMESPLGSTALEAQPSMSFVLRGHQSPPKRRRLSDSLLYGQWASSQDPSRVVGHAIPGPGERLAPDSHPGKRRKEHTFQDGREK